jgi:uncharacterized protein (TIGR02145 family)
VLRNAKPFIYVTVSVHAKKTEKAENPKKSKHFKNGIHMKKQIILNQLTILGILIFFFISCNNIEKDWGKAIKQNSIAGYNEFIKNHSDSVYSILAKNAIDSLQWLEDSISKDTSKIRKYISDDKSSHYRTKAQNLFFQLTGNYVDLRDGRSYKTVKIGEQIWMAENFAYKPSNGNYWVYDNDTTNLSKYGYLYDWKTANLVAPNGWHLASIEEWEKIASHNDVEKSYQLLKQGGDYRLNVLLGGLYEFDTKKYIGKGQITGFWTSSFWKNEAAWAYMLDSSQKAAGAHAAGQKCGAYVRLVLNNKDSISFAKLNSKSGNIDEIKWNDNNHGYFIDNRDNKKYKIIKIGNQVWMAENLSYNESIGCWAYENKQSNALIYGYLYTWESAKKACPNGWHLPSNEEWGELKIHLGGNNEIADGKMKEEGTSHWKSPNRDANNQSGFTALPGGIRTKGSFKGIGDMGVWWSATGNHFGDTKTAASMGLTFDNSSSSFGLIENGTTEGFSVRCIKD